MTQRIEDQNGWTYIKKNPISKAGVFPYLGSEIGAPEPSRVYRVFRAPSELKSAAHTFSLLPLIDEHEILGKHGTSTDERPAAGFTGEQVTYDHPYLYAPIKITSPKLMDSIQRGKVELSPAYFSTWEPSEGVYEGEPYEYVQRITAGNHIALVSRGRTGADVAVLDHQTFAFDTGEALMNLDELIAAIADMSDEDKAKLLAVLSPAADETPKEDEPATDDVTDLIERVDHVDEHEAEEIKREDVQEIRKAGEAVANAEAVLEAAEELKEMIAEDAMSKAIKHIDARNAMAAKVKPFFGVVPAAAMDSAETIAAYCLDKQGIKHAKGQAAAVISGFLHGRKPASEQTIAQDAKPVTAADTASKFWKE